MNRRIYFDLNRLNRFVSFLSFLSFSRFRFLVLSFRFVSFRSLVSLVSFRFVSSYATCNMNHEQYSISSKKGKEKERGKKLVEEVPFKIKIKISKAFLSFLLSFFLLPTTFTHSRRIVRS